MPRFDEATFFMASHNKLQIKSGDRFGRLTAIKETKPRLYFHRGKKHIIRKFTFQCDCGAVVDKCLPNVIHGKTSSCGCYHLEVIKSQKPTLRHGLTNHPTHYTWREMRARCSNENHHAFKDYGGRGITVCDEWQNDFVSFYNWSIANGYKKGLSIDRKDNNLGYSPDNCRWATRKEQGNNTRDTIRISWDGEEHSVTTLCEKLGIDRTKIYWRLKKGVSIIDAIRLAKKPTKANAVSVS